MFLAKVLRVILTVMFFCPKGGRGVGNNFTAHMGRESREVTLKKARLKLVALANQLHLRKAATFTPFTMPILYSLQLRMI